jgi:hypothetical protein
MFETKTNKSVVNQQEYFWNNEETDSASGNEEVEIEVNIVDAMIAYVDKKFGVGTTDLIEYYLNEYDTSLKDICQDPGSVADAFYMIFGCGADVVADSILKAAFESLGYESEKGYTRFDIGRAVTVLKEQMKNSALKTS